MFSFVVTPTTVRFARLNHKFLLPLCGPWIVVMIFISARHVWRYDNGKHLNHGPCLPESVAGVSHITSDQPQAPNPSTGRKKLIKYKYFASIARRSQLRVSMWAESSLAQAMFGMVPRQNTRVNNERLKIV
jgi:hypothetical protein